MLHKDRRFVVSDVADAETLAHKLTAHDWCACTGFRLAGLLFLNDGGPGEYAVVREATLEQIESITFGWCSEFKALEYIEELVSGRLGTAFTVISNPIETPALHGTCGHCA